MGADMMTIALFFIYDENHSLKKLQEVTDSLTTSDVDLTNDFFIGIKDYERTEDPYILIEKTKQFLYELIEGIHSRETDYFQGRSFIMYITGGLSFGDYPTEAFSLYERAHSLPDAIKQKLGMIDGFHYQDLFLNEYLARNPDMPEALKEEINKYEFSQKI